MTLASLRKDAAFGLGLLARRPFQVLLQVTNRCNMRCSFCDFWPNPAPRGEELTLADFERVARELAEIGCFLVSIEGGEPLVRPDLEGIVRAFAARHIPMLFTNGWYVREENARALFAAGLQHASVSIDYPDRERHDGKRALHGTTERAWRAVEILRDAAPRGGKQVHVMTVLMQSNHADIERLVEMSAAHGVGHQFTLLSDKGFRRGRDLVDRLPPPSIAARLTALWDRYPHIRFFRDYFERLEPFLAQQAMPRCRAGLQSFNIDHLGNVAPCIEKIDRVIGNVKEDSLGTLHRRLGTLEPEIASCQDCWTACRGFNQALGDGGTARGLLELATRMRPG
jgi:MoaA/NifB/PqqE/SkfB family radical SAM enzyme